MAFSKNLVLATLLFPLVAAVVLLIFTKGRLSYKPEPAPQPIEAPRLAEMPQTTV